MRSFGLIVVFALALGAVACGDDHANMREWQPTDHGQPQDPGTSQQQAAQTGLEGNQEERAVAALWQVSCASCHGMEGRGDGPGRPPGAQVRNLSDPEWQGTVTDADILAVVSEGRGMMPRFDDRINARGLELLVVYVRRLGGLIPAPPGEGVQPGEPPMEGGAPDEDAPDEGASDVPAPAAPAPAAPTPAPAAPTPAPAAAPTAP